MQGESLRETTEVCRLRVIGNRLAALRIPVWARDGCLMFGNDGLNEPVVTFARITRADLTVGNTVFVLTSLTKGSLRRVCFTKE